MADYLFIRSDVDDAGLDPESFRVLCHLRRRADNDKGIAHAGIKSMAKVCRMNKDTIARRLRDLVADGWLERVKRPGMTTAFRLVDAPPIRREGISDNRGYPSKSDGPIRREGMTPIRREGNKGNPVIPEGNPTGELAFGDNQPDANNRQPTQRATSPSPVTNQKARKRDPLFDTLAVIEGTNLDELTKTAAKRIGTALSEIREACPELTPDEIRRRAEVYRTKNPKAPVTAHAIAANWPKLGTTTSPALDPATFTAHERSRNQTTPRRAGRSRLP